MSSSYLGYCYFRGLRGGASPPFRCVQRASCRPESSRRPAAEALRLLVFSEAAAETTKHKNSSRVIMGWSCGENNTILLLFSSFSSHPFLSCSLTRPSVFQSSKSRQRLRTSMELHSEKQRRSHRRVLDVRPLMTERFSCLWFGHRMMVVLPASQPGRCSKAINETNACSSQKLFVVSCAERFYSG